MTDRGKYQRLSSAPPFHSSHRTALKPKESRSRRNLIIFVRHQSLFADRFLQRSVGGKGSGSRTAGPLPSPHRVSCHSHPSQPWSEHIPQRMGTAASHEIFVPPLLMEHCDPQFRGMLLRRRQDDEASCSGERLWGSRTAAFLDCIFQQQRSNPLFRFSHLKSLQRP